MSDYWGPLWRWTDEGVEDAAESQDVHGIGLGTLVRNLLALAAEQDRGLLVAEKQSEDYFYFSDVRILRAPEPIVLEWEPHSRIRPLDTLRAWPDLFVPREVDLERVDIDWLAAEAETDIDRMLTACFPAFEQTLERAGLDVTRGPWTALGDLPSAEITRLVRLTLQESGRQALLDLVQQAEYDLDTTFEEASALDDNRLCTWLSDVLSETRFRLRTGDVSLVRDLAAKWNSAYLALWEFRPLVPGMARAWFAAQDGRRLSQAVASCDEWERILAQRLGIGR